MNASSPSLTTTAIFAHEHGKKQLLPLFLAKVSAGFPSSADDFLEKKIDLNKHLVRHPAATFFVRVEGESMKNAGIRSGDILIVDRSLEARDAAVVVAVIDGEFMVKHVKKEGKKLFLVPANEDFSPVAITGPTPGASVNRLQVLSRVRSMRSAIVNYPHVQACSG